MSIFLIIAAGIAVYLYFRWSKRSHINAIRSGEIRALMKWSYSPEDRDWYAGEPSSRWIRRRNIPVKSPKMMK